ncbi:sodium:solute symporter family protein [Ruminococcaceae bacterium TF06-43]|jgi:Na+/proline symporter|nr:sodium:solute symporter family protein [Ruminococcaceae bacterium TF06-43]
MTSIYVALIIYLVILFAVGIYYSKKNATISDFLLAGKSLGVIAATLTISASLFGGGLLTGTAQKAYNSGPMMYVYGIFGSGFGLLLASFLVKKMKDFSNFGTITEYLETRYNSKFLRSASAFLSMVALIALVGSQVGAAVGIMNALGMKNTTIAALFACIVIIALTSMGGLMAVTVTDGFQIILVMVGVVWITVAALGDIGGLSGLNASLTAIQSELPEGYNVFMDSEKFKSLLWMILPGLMYIMIGQDIYQRLFACKDHKTAIKASVCSAVLVCIVSVMPVTLGLIARVKHPELATAGTSAAAFATIAMSTLPGWAVGIIIAAALSAIFSTADSCLSAAASHFMTDLYLPYIGKNVDTKDRRLVTISRAFTVIAGLAAVGVSMLLPTILDGCFYAYYIYTSGVFCPIVFGVFWKKATKQGAIAGLLAGGLFMMYALLTGFSVAGIGGELLSGIVSAIVLVVVSLATQPKKTAA